MKKQYISKKDIKSYKDKLDGLFNIISNSDIIKSYIEEMGWDYLTEEIDRLEYIKNELCQSEVSKDTRKVNELDDDFKEEFRPYYQRVDAQRSNEMAKKVTTPQAQLITKLEEAIELAEVMELNTTLRIVLTVLKIVLKIVVTL
jgi:hypothetical protein